jgi:hypothetical protein
MIYILLLMIGSSIAVASSAHGGQYGFDLKAIRNSSSEAPQGPLPAPTGHVNDYAHALNEDTREQLEQALGELKKRSKIDFAVALVNTTTGKPILDYSKAVFQSGTLAVAAMALCCCWLSMTVSGTFRPLVV